MKNISYEAGRALGNIKIANVCIIQFKLKLWISIITLSIKSTTLSSIQPASYSNSQGMKLVYITSWRYVNDVSQTSTNKESY